MLAEKTGVHKDQIRLVFKGKPMLDDKTLDEQGVKAGSIVHMIMQMRGSICLISFSPLFVYSSYKPFSIVFRFCCRRWILTIVLQ